MATSDGGTFYPGTSTLVTHSFEEALYNAEFDDALLDQASWKNSRYDGSKLTAQRLNKFTTGDSTFQNLPTIPYTSTAIYLANTVVGGEEDNQFATIKNHSYVGINRILLINQDTDSVQILDRSSEPYSEFHRFITNDFPTGTKCKVKIIDDSISTNLKGLHRVKMNKGYLLKSFEFNHAGEKSGSGHSHPVLLENNSMYLYKSGSIRDNFRISSSVQAGLATSSLNNQLRFRYGIIETIPQAVAGNGHQLNEARIGPSFVSSSIFKNKFTVQYHSGSFGLIKHQADTQSNKMAKFLATTGLGSASRFIGVNTLNFLKNNKANATLSEQEKTEVHVTFFDGTKDFAPGAHDERSISTFEVDQNIAALGIEQAGKCSDGIPTNHEITFKGPNDGRFMPTTNTYEDDFVSGHAVSHTAGEVGGNITLDSDGCTPLNEPVTDEADGAGETNQHIQFGLAVDRIDNADVYVQGGALGEVGFQGIFSASDGSSYGVSQLGNMTADNFFSGSFSYEISFLDKDHTLILNLDKDEELFDGIGEKGLLVMPINTDPQVAFNIEYYLEKAGVIDSTSANQQQISPNTTNE